LGDTRLLGGCKLLEKVSVAFSICISIASIIIAILSYRLNLPRIKIQILNKNCDCFFGNVKCENGNNGVISRISGAKIRLVNSSRSDIAVLSVLLETRDECFRLIDCQNPFWEVVEFVFSDDEGDEATDGSAIYYKNEGIQLPLTIKAYSGIDFIALFHHFPLKIRKSASARIIIQTAVGAITKKVTITEYGQKYNNSDYLDVMQFMRSKKVDE
jgi:hypothetical protein